MEPVELLIRHVQGGTITRPSRHSERTRMRTNQSVNIEQLEGRSFTIGREGHIYIDSATASVAGKVTPVGWAPGSHMSS